MSEAHADVVDGADVEALLRRFYDRGPGGRAS
jgi:hypothetical protein